MPEKPLPELPPEMLLSASACRELEAARQDHYMPAQRAPRVTRDRQEFSRPTATQEVGYFDIEALDQAPPDDGNDITFDQGEDIEFDTPPERHASGGGVGGGRFNVLRPPVREPFRPVIASGPQGGRMQEVGRVGRFAILAEQDRTPPVERESTLIPREAIIAGRARPYDFREEMQTSARTSAQYNQLQTAKQQAERAAIHKSLPTAYDRLLGDDPYDDDLE